MSDGTESGETTRRELVLIGERAGITLSDDELAKLAALVSENRAGLDRLRAVLLPDEEPAHTFAKQVGRNRA
jgi:hypothetical protein